MAFTQQHAAPVGMAPAPPLCGSAGGASKEELLGRRQHLNRLVPFGAYADAHAAVHTVIAREHYTLTRLGYVWPTLLLDDADADGGGGGAATAHWTRAHEDRATATLLRSRVRAALGARIRAAIDATPRPWVLPPAEIESAAAAAAAATGALSDGYGARLALQSALAARDTDADPGALVMRILAELEGRRYECTGEYVPDLQWYSASYTTGHLVLSNLHAWERAIEREAVDPVSVGWRILAMAAYAPVNRNAAPDTEPHADRVGERWRWDALANARVQLSATRMLPPVARPTPDAHPFALLQSVGV